VQIWIDNTNLLELFRLKSAVENAFVNNATVTVTIVDGDGEEVEGQTWPATMTYVTSSSGDYRAILSHQLQLEPDTTYFAIIDANGGTNRIGHWEISFLAKTRRQ
jgi:hypothetical protein